MTHIFLGLGSNLGDRLQYLKQAIILLKEQKIIYNAKISPIYESIAHMPDNAPTSWNKNFFNLVISADTKLNPQDLLQKIKGVEHQIGRKKRGFWAPREIDIDILIYEDLEYVSESLMIPHPYFLERAFTLLPANDLKPNYKYPKEGVFYRKPLAEIIKLNNFNDAECYKTKHVI